MREINFKVYSYDELSDEAKHVAIEKSRQSVGDVCSEFDSDDYRATLYKMEQIFGIEVNRWEVGLCSRPWFEFSFDDFHYNEGEDWGGLTFEISQPRGSSTRQQFQVLFQGKKLQEKQGGPCPLRILLLPHWILVRHRGR